MRRAEASAASSQRAYGGPIVALLVFLAGLTMAAQTPRRQRPVVGDFSPKPPVRALTPQEEAARFVMPPGYHLELVLAEPEVVNPAQIAFDGNGRMFVLELRSYMLDADARDESAPISRISMHESTKGDGVFDRHTVYIDHLVTPRMVTPLDNSVLTMETDKDDIYRYRDTDGDGVADEHELFFSGAGRKGNLEHQPSGFVWGLDNWIYSTYNAFRLRWTPTGVRTGPTAQNGGQWGLAQDDYGKMWFVDAGGERGPVNFQAPIVYGAFNVDDQFEKDFEVTWPIGPGISDMQGGLSRIRMPLGVLNHFTAACGQDIYRGDRLPADLRGDLLFAEPVGRLIRRAKVVVRDGLTQLRNAYPQSEFILSTDPLFRPVNMTTAPDGTIYIADMYHGIIQESEWAKPGTYLRKKIEQYQLDKVNGYGRVWRLVHDDVQRDRTPPRMLEETPAQLATHLTHPNGWWRDTAQKLLVLRQDRSVVPDLQALARSSDNLLGRIHALWTLEGLDALDAALVRELLKDPAAEMRVQALRASESLYKAGDRSLEADMRRLTSDADARVVIQAMLTLNLLKAPDIADIVRAARETNKSRGVQEIGEQIVHPRTYQYRPTGVMTAEQQRVMEQGASIYNELCSACHGQDGKGAPLAGAPAGTTMAPPLAGSARVTGHGDYVIKALLHGLTGPIDGNTYTGVMVPMGANDDAWVAAVGTYVRNSFGNVASAITPDAVARVRAAEAKRESSWTVEELEASLPAEIESKDGWRLTASHNAQMAADALGTRSAWSSREPQQAGMWFQIELPEATPVSELAFDSIVSFRSGAGDQGGVVIVGFPRAYKVEASTDGASWQTLAEGQGHGPTTDITFPAAQARLLRLTQTATVPNAPPWSIERLRLYRPRQADSARRRTKDPETLTPHEGAR